MAQFIHQYQHGALPGYEGSEIDELVKTIVDKTAVAEKLEDKHYKDLAEAER